MIAENVCTSVRWQLKGRERRATLFIFTEQAMILSFFCIHNRFEERITQDSDFHLPNEFTQSNSLNHFGICV